MSDIERVELQGIIWVTAGKIDIDDMPLEVFIAQAFDAEMDDHGLIKHNGILGRAKITIEVLPDS